MTYNATANRPGLSDTLAASGALSRLRAFALATGCDPLELSSDHGQSLNWICVLDVMRRRGYSVGEPVRPQAQPRRGSTAWTVAIGVKGVRAMLVFHILNEQP
jgi:hypothetical protein